MRRATATLAVAAAVTAAGCGSGARTVTVTRTAEDQTQKPATTASPPAPTATACTDGACAARVLAKRGFTANPASFDSGRPLNVLVGIRTGSADGTAQNAFFFWQGRYIGTDTADISAGIRIEAQAGDTATLVYRLYNPRDPQCCATAGQATVRYRYEGSRLVPLAPIPPSSYSARGSRR